MKNKRIIAYIFAVVMIIGMLPAKALADAGYNVTYDVNGAVSGTVPSDVNTYQSGDTVTALGNTGGLAKTGCTFNGWNTAADGTGTAYLESDILTMPADNVTLFAQWGAINCTVIFDSQGGSSVSGWTGNFGDSISSPVTSKAGYSFCGWYPSAACDTAAVVFPYTVASETTLYAKWQHISPYLNGVSLSSGTLLRTFKKTVYSYKVLLGENDGSVTITPFKENDNATMKINGVVTSSVTVSIENGKTKTEKVKVIYGGHTKVYTFVVKRAKSANNDLASLTASAGTFNIPFDPSVTNYTLNLDEFTFKVSISASKLSPLSTLRIDGRRVTSKTYTVGQGKIANATISVRSQSGVTKTYTVVISRAETTYPDKVSALIEFAKTNLGKPYVRGGKGPDSFDCSGFVYYCLKSIGTQINYMTSAVWPTSSWTTIASIGDMLPGDILCFQGHVGIYLGGNKMIDASSSARCVRISSGVSPYWTSNFICGKRVLNNQ